MTRTFLASHAERRNQPLLLGLAGPPGAGKTLSSLKLATGIQRHRGGPIRYLDTESNRALQYAPRKGEKADGIRTFDFEHVPFAPPFASMDFLDAVRQQLADNPACVIIDSMSDEHEGAGGLLAQHDDYLDEKAGDDWQKRERLTQAAWIKPKAGRREMMNGFLQISTPLIFAFRAREKTKPIKDDRGKNVPTNIGWTPIAPVEIVHSMTLFCLLPIKSDGVPMWKGSTAYEDFSIKLPLQFRDFIQDGEPLSEDMGERMSQWAKGDDAGSEPDAAAISLYQGTVAEMVADAAEPATLGTWWNSPEQKSLRKSIRLPAEVTKSLVADVTAKINQLKSATANPGDNGETT